MRCKGILMDLDMTLFDFDACWLNPDGRALPRGVRAECAAMDILACVPIALS